MKYAQDAALDDSADITRPVDPSQPPPQYRSDVFQGDWVPDAVDRYLRANEKPQDPMLLFKPG